MEIVAPQMLRTTTGNDVDEQGLRQQVQDAEEILILRALQEQGTLDRTAAYLGIGRATLTRKLKKIREKNDVILT